jgi:hypothetical protein
MGLGPCSPAARNLTATKAADQSQDAEQDMNSFR